LAHGYPSNAEVEAEADVWPEPEPTVVAVAGVMGEKKVVGLDALDVCCEGIV